MIYKDEIELCAELLRIMILDEFDPVFDPESGTVHKLRKGLRTSPRAISVSYELAHLIIKLQISKPINEDDLANFNGILIIELSELRAHLLRIGSKTVVTVADIINSFAGITLFQNEIYPYHRNLFYISDNLTYLSQLLIKHGYLSKSGESFCWTDKIGPAMMRAGIWNSDFKMNETY